MRVWLPGAFIQAFSGIFSITNAPFAQVPRAHPAIKSVAFGQQKRISTPLKSSGKYRVNLCLDYTAFTNAGQQWFH
jgi:hypothetical protein